MCITNFDHLLISIILVYACSQLFFKKETWQQRVDKYRSENKHEITNINWADSTIITFIDSTAVYIDDFSSINKVLDLTTSKKIRSSSLLYMKGDSNIIIHVWDEEGYPFRREEEDVFTGLGRYGVLTEQWGYTYVFSFNQPDLAYKFPRFLQYEIINDSILSYCVEEHLYGNWKGNPGQQGFNESDIDRVEIENKLSVVLCATMNLRTGEILPSSVRFTYTGETYSSIGFIDCVGQCLNSFAEKDEELRQKRLEELQKEYERQMEERRQSIIDNAETVSSLTSNQIQSANLIGSIIYFKHKFKEITSSSLSRYNYLIRDYPNIWSGGYYVKVYSNDNDFTQIEYPNEIIISGRLKSIDPLEIVDAELLLYTSNKN